MARELVKSAHRPDRTALTTEIARRIISAISLGASVAIAAHYAGVSKATLAKWIEAGDADPLSAYAPLVRAIDAARGQHAIRNLEIVQRAANDGEYRAAQWMLERVHGYSSRGAVAVQVAEGEGHTRTFVELIRAGIADDEDFGPISEAPDDTD